MSESLTTASAMTEHPAQRSPLALDAIYYVSAVSYTVYMFYYYWTSAGGPVVLAMTMVPLTFGLFTLRSLRDNEFYPKLPRSVNYVIALAFCLFSIYCSYYMNTNYRALGEERNGFYDTQDIIIGGADGAADHRIRAQAPCPAVHPQRHHHSLRRLRLYGAGHVLSCRA